MKKQEIEKILKNDSRLKGLDVSVGDERIEVYGFHQTPDWKATKQILEEMGFSCGPNFGSIEFPANQPSIRDRYERMDDRAQYQADMAWIASGGHLADVDRENAILAGMSYDEYIDSIR